MAQKLVGQITIKSKGDVFHELLSSRPHHISNLSGEHIQGCALVDGTWGTVGSTILWNCFHDGKERVSKQIIEAVDKEQKLVKFKVIGGDLTELYKTFSFTCDVDTTTGDDHLVTWTLDYEKLKDDVPDPHTLMDFCLAVAKQIEIHG